MSDQVFCDKGRTRLLDLVHAATAAVTTIPANTPIIKLPSADRAVVFQLGHVLTA